MSETIIKIDHVSKEYRLGAIGGGTLRGDLQSWWAKVRGKDDPNLQIGKTAYTGNEKFLALDDVSFEVKKGEALGIIGHNGAGKSTLLKLLSRVTAPTKGTIGYNGRIASMLEVGTGFHPELTGRENVYMNGAILGMTKAEINRKFDQIVEFAEMEKFIDTPVKRYSSGMYVKLAFAVAAHLDSEIMIMDEVLAVGDMSFQKKCLDKMRDVSTNGGRTILYVSHNMNTIRQLCDRCIVLDKGKVSFNGAVDDSICAYLGTSNPMQAFIDCNNIPREPIGDGRMHIKSVEIIGSNTAIIGSDGKMELCIKYSSFENYNEIAVRFVVFNSSHTPVGMTASHPMIFSKAGENSVKCMADFSYLSQGQYSIRAVLYEVDTFGNEQIHDVVEPAFSFQKSAHNQFNDTSKRWNQSVWGNVVIPTIQII